MYLSKSLNSLLSILAVSVFISCTQPVEYDLLIKNGEIFDGSGEVSFSGDIGINADTIAALGNLWRATGKKEIDAKGLAVSPGFINMLSWATQTLMYDGRGMSDLRQGVTLEVFGEGWSMGPLNDEMIEAGPIVFGENEYEIEWTTLGEYLEYLEKKGVSPNVASFIGATTLRIHQIGYENRPPTQTELENMKELVREAMQEGALGIGSSLIYAPAFFSSTEELIELSKVVAEYNGMYISHMRSEGNRLLESLDELIRISAEAGLPAEVYHLKMAGESNWDKYDAVVEKIDSARKAGLEITTNMYTYTAGATGLDAAMPPWVQEGGYDAWANRLKDPEIRRRVIEEMRTESDEWENLLLSAGSPDKVLFVSFSNDSLKHLTGKTLAEVSEMRGISPEETAMDLVIEDGSRVGTVYFLMSEENVKKQIALPYMTFGSDGGAPAPEGVFLERNQHPRAYGTFARLLGKYVRDEQVIPLHEAIHKLTGMPASRLKIQKRGKLEVGYYADITIFDPETITDHATFEDSHQLATGVIHVFVNGTQVIEDQEHTGATPGRFVRGPGYQLEQ